jgi:hypothetical protein
VRLHKRVLVVQQAEHEIHTAISELVDKHKLTCVEELQVLMRYMDRQLKYALRSERHPKDPGKGADEA